MEELVKFWPIIVYITGLFFTVVGTCISLTLWITSKLNRQDAERTVLKEVILKEVRDKHEQHNNNMFLIVSGLKDTINSFGNRLTRLETIVIRNGRSSRQRDPEPPHEFDQTE